MGWLSAAPSWGAEEAASIYNKEGVKHNSQCIPPTGKTVVMRGVNGNQLQATGGPVSEPPEEGPPTEPEGCTGKSGIRVEGIESTKAKGVPMYYSWPLEKGSQSAGFVAASELASKPPVDLEPKDAAGNGAAAGRVTGEPYYKVAPAQIEKSQEYKGGNTWYTFSVYGLPIGGAKFAMMTWSWINVNAGGIARAVAEEGESFYPGNVEPITTPTYGGENKPENGTVTVRYGYLNSGEKLVWGWMVTSHTYEGVCSNNMSYVSGGTPLPKTLCPGAITAEPSGKTPTGATLNGTVYPNGAESHYYFQYGTSVCAPTSCGTTQPAPPGTKTGSSGAVAASTTVSLSPGTTYHYRVVASNVMGTSYGVEQTFNTPGPVEAVTTAATAVQEEKTTLNGTINPRGYPAKYYFEYGPTTAYGSVTAEGETGDVEEGAHIEVAGLQPGMIYHYRVVATSGGVTAEGHDESFRTRAAPAMNTADGIVEGVTGGVNSALLRTSSDFVQDTWLSGLLGSAGTIDSAPSSVVDSGGDVWTAFEGTDNQLSVGLDRPSGGWGMSYEGPGGTTYSSPSVAIDSNKNLWVAAEGPNHTLNLAEDSANKWTTSTPISGADVYSTPSVVADSGGDLWVAFEGPDNSLWIGLRRANGEWGLSYEGPTGTTYSAPSTVIADGNVWVAAEGPNDTLNLAEDSGSQWTTSTPVTAADVYSAPSAVVDSGGDVWVAFQGPGNQLWVGLHRSDGEWGMSYEGPSNTTYSAPSAVIESGGNIWVGAEGAGNTLGVTVRLTSGTWEISYEGTPDSASTDNSPSLVAADGGISAATQGIADSLFVTSSDFVQDTWLSGLLGGVGTIDSAPSSVVDSGGDVWTAFEGTDNSLWVGLDRPSGGWGMSYEGPSGTTYSSPSVAIDSNKNLWVAAEGPNHTLDLAEDSANKWTTSTPISAADVYSAPSVVGDSGGDLWVAFEGPGNQLWIGLRRANGEWGMSYEGPGGTTYSAPSTVIADGNVWVAAEGPNDTLNLAEDSGSQWTMSTPVTAADVYSAPSAVVDSGGDVWVAFQGPSNQLWVGLHRSDGEWGMSYQGLSNTTYSAPSAVIESGGNIWVGAEGAGNTLGVTVRLASPGTWEVSYEGA